MRILSHIVSQGILGYRTAIELKPQVFQGKAIIFVISSYAKTINLPGLMIKVYKGDNSQFIEHVLPELARSNTPRMLLENLSTVRGAAYIGIKTVGVEGIEKFLTKELRLRGEGSINSIRDQANQIAQTLGYQHEYQKLNQMMSALLSTHPDEHALITPF